MSSTNFSIKRVWSILRIRNKEFYRDKGAMAWVFVFPIIMILAFGYMFDIDKQTVYKLGYSKASGITQSQLPKVDMSQWVQYETKEQGLKKLQNQLIDLFIDFSQDPPAYYKADSSPKSDIAQMLYLEKYKIFNTYEPEVRKIKGRTVKYIDWVFPGILCMNAMLMSMWGVGWVVVRQRKIGVLKRFKASPIKPIEYLLAQMLSRLMLISISGAILFAGAHLIYPFHTEGSYLAIFSLYVLGTFSMSSIGLIIASRIQSEEFASGLINLLTYPMLFLSEVWFSLEGSPQWVKNIAEAIPLWHMTSGIRNVMNQGIGFYELIPSFIILIGVSLVCTVIGSMLFKWTKD